MNNYISQVKLNLIKNLTLIFFLSCTPSKKADDPVSMTPDALRKKYRSCQLAVPSGKILDVTILITQADHLKGISGIRKDEFGENEALLFYYPKFGPRSFWMPDTHFDIDIIFLDKNLKVLKVAKNMKAHPGHKTPPPIQRTDTIWADYVLEIKAQTEIAKEIKEGITFKWMSSWSLSEIKSNIHLWQ